MFYRLRQKVAGWPLRRALASVFDTPPLRLVDAPLTIVSMATGRYSAMYLMALKSFYARLGRGKVVAITDRATPESERDLQRRHVPGIRFVYLEDIDTGSCQRGKCWERLCYLLDLSRDEYCIQLDGDTLTVGDIPEVFAAVDANRAFTLNGGEGTDFMSLHEIAAWARTIDSGYIGILAERAMAEMADAGRYRYIHGSAGFAGFAKGGFTRAQIESYDGEMRRLLPDIWSKWGSEQCASNFAIANSPDPVVLRRPRYTNYGPKSPRDCDFFHFIGEHRYQDGLYARLVRREIKRLQAGAAAR